MKNIYVHKNWRIHHICTTRLYLLKQLFSLATEVGIDGAIEACIEKILLWNSGLIQQKFVFELQSEKLIISKIL